MTSIRAAGYTSHGKPPGTAGQSVRLGSACVPGLHPKEAGPRHLGFAPEVQADPSGAGQRQPLGLGVSTRLGGGGDYQHTLLSVGGLPASCTRPWGSTTAPCSPWSGRVHTPLGGLPARAVGSWGSSKHRVQAGLGLGCVHTLWSGCPHALGGLPAPCSGRPASGLRHWGPACTSVNRLVRGHRGGAYRPASLTYAGL